MRFFTLQWWFADSPRLDSSFDPHQVFVDYDTYLNSIKASLSDLPEFITNPSGLHDYGIQAIHVGRNTVKFDLIEPESGCKKALTLSGVGSFSKAYGNEVSPKYMDEAIGYHELELDAQHSTLTVSLICNTTAEIIIVCALKEFKVEING